MKDYPNIERDVPAWATTIIPRFTLSIRGKTEDTGVEYSREELNPAWLTGLAQFIRAVVREMGRKALSGVYPTPGTDSPMVSNIEKSELAERLAHQLMREVVEGIAVGGWITGVSVGEATRILLPRFRLAVEGRSK